MAAAERYADQVRTARVDLWATSLPLMGWHAARALIELEAGDPDGALASISVLDANIHEFEHWPYLLWVKALVRLSNRTPGLGIDELEGSLSANRGRVASRFGQATITAIRSDLLLATGHPARARAMLAGVGDSAPTPLLLARSRVDLADDESARVSRRMRALVGHRSVSIRERAEALLLQAVADERLGVHEEARLTADRAIELTNRNGLRTPLLMVPRADLVRVLSDHALDGIPDPFGAAVTVVALTRRERELLAGLSSGRRLDALAADQHVSLNTVKTHLQNLYRKLGVRSRSDAIAVGRQRGLL